MSRRLCRGGSLLDVLVALSVLTLGLLAVTAIQFSARQAQLDAELRHRATLLAIDLLERMRLSGQPGAYIRAAAGPCAGRDRACRRAALDLAAWQTLLNGTTVARDGRPVGGLPESGRCLQATANEGEYLLTLVWRGFGHGQAATLPGACAASGGEHGAENRRRRSLSLAATIR